MEEGRNVYRVLVGKPEGKRPLDKPRRRWEDWIKMDLREMGWGCVECGDTVWEEWAGLFIPYPKLNLVFPSIME
jgi:hypothetical protein